MESLQKMLGLGHHVLASGKDGSDCIYTSLIGKPVIGYERIDGYNEIMQKYNYAIGSFHVLALLIYVSYIVFAIFRKHRMSRFQWVNLVNLCVIELLTTIK